MRKKIIIFVLIVAVVGGAFYGGVKYSSTKNSASLSGGMRNVQDFQNMTQEERQQRMQEMGGGARRTGQVQAGQGFQGGFAGVNSGEIISKDETSVTIKLRDGGSKIIFFSDTTKISKFTDGTIDDLTIGENITASGEANSDGSVVANNIQLRPVIE